MRIAFAINEDKGLDSLISERFGRAPYFLIVEVSNDFKIVNYEVVENPGAKVMGGAASKASQLLASKSVSAVVAGNFGPHAMSVLPALNIKAIALPPSIKVKDAISRLRELLSK